jgi:hypothetical protein
MDPTFLAEIQTDYFFDLIYLVCLFLPWVCLGLLPELLVWIKTLCPCGQARNLVGIIPQTQLLPRIPTIEPQINI